MTDSIIEKAKAAVFMACKGKHVVANGDRLHLYFLSKEIENIDKDVLMVYSKKSRNRLLIVKL